MKRFFAIPWIHSLIAALLTVYVFDMAAMRYYANSVILQDGGIRLFCEGVLFFLSLGTFTVVTTLGGYMQISIKSQDAPPSSAPAPTRIGVK